MSVIALIICVLCMQSSAHGQDTITVVDVTTVRVEQGFLRGRHVPSRAGGGYFSFQGVPYARPPVGPLRFKDAEPPEPWTGERDALREGHKCTQYDVEIMEYAGEEDCLFLNVYTPRLHAADAPPLPVMVYIHGGGFVFGSGNAEFYGPDFLVSEGVVLVTMNYRLGPFGFLYLEEAAPGNAGLKDQVMALRWVRDNIATFGGDPDNVTIFGESAGGASVHMHMLSPMSKGLFQRAIAQSGAALNPWAAQRRPLERARRLARAVGCDARQPPAAVARCLRAVEHMRLMRAARNDVPTDEDRLRLLKFSFVPSSEFQTEGVEAFLPAPAEQMMKEGRHHAVPYMTGFTSQEGVLILAFNAANFFDASVQREMDGAWADTVLPELRLDAEGRAATATATKEVLATLRAFYMDGQPLSGDTLRAYLNMFADITFGEGVMYAINSMAAYAKAPLYLYSFAVDDDLNFLKKAFDITWEGASHADDLGYLFEVERLRCVPDDSAAALARRRMVRLWTNFAKSADPTPIEDPLLGVRWKPYTEQERNFLEIGSTLQPGVDLNANRTAFWEMLYLTYAS